MKQKRIKSVNNALDQATQAIGGATEHGAAIGIKQNDAAAITADRDDLVTADNAHKVAKAELKTRRITLTALMLTAITFVTLARELLKIHLGRQYSTAWEMVGFDGTLEIPRSLAGIKVLLERLFAYFTANPARQNNDANITALRAKAIFDEIVAAENGANAQKTTVRTATATKDAAYKALCKRLRGTFREISQKVQPTSVVYLSFGFNIPGVQSTPAVPTNLVAVLVGASAAALTWARAERAERYRIWKKVVGGDAHFVLVETRNDLDFVLEGLPANATVQIAVSAVNNGGESELSQFVTVTTH